MLTSTHNAHTSKRWWLSKVDHSGEGLVELLSCLIHLRYTNEICFLLVEEIRMIDEVVGND